MEPNEIRAIPTTTVTGALLQEIAAQLAELNQFLWSQTDKLVGGGVPPPSETTTITNKLISLCIPVDLLAEIDEEADRELRGRTQLIITKLKASMGYHSAKVVAGLEATRPLVREETEEQ
jgi:hypothetical protein